MMTLRNNKTVYPRSWLSVCAVGILQLPLANQSLADAGPFEFKYYVDARYRVELVDQSNFANDAKASKASTLRTNLGGSVALPLLKHSSVAFFTELQDVSVVGMDDYNSTTNSKTTYPIVADPEGTEFNQVALAWTMGKNAKVTVGRQKINLGNQRFIGSVGWRQNDQTFDSLLATYKTQRGDELLFGYLSNVNRINGNQHPDGDLDSDSYLLHAVFSASGVKLNPYVYSLSFDDKPTMSAQTLGANVAGQVNIRANSRFNYYAELAQQFDYDNNPGDFSLSYLATEVGMQYSMLSWGAGFEILEGEGTGTLAFQTPLATLHKFNGWADKFLTTPPDGLVDSYFKVGNLNWLTMKWSFEYHWYAAERVSRDYGQELGILATHKFNDHFELLAKYANYQEEGYVVDTRKFWVALNIRFE